MRYCLKKPYLFGYGFCCCGMRVVEGSCEIFYFCFRFHRRIPQSACGCQLSTRHALRVPFQGSLDTNEPPLKGEGDQRSWWRGSVESFTSVSGFTEESLRLPFGCLFKRGYCVETPPLPNGGSPRTERSPLPCGHLPTPWGVTPFRGGFFSPTKLPWRGIQAAAAAVTLPFSQLKLGRKVSGDPPH